MIDIGVEWLLFLLAAGFFAGFVDAIAGGGGLITVPTLMLAGVPPVQALATNKIQGLFGSGTAAFTYAKSGLVNFREQRLPAVLAFAASVVGALLVSVLPVAWIRMVLPVLLIGVAVFFAVRKDPGDMDRTARLSPLAFTWTAVPLVAAYDGVLGPGAGSFYMIAFVAFGGFAILKATAHTKLLNFASNLGGLTGFILVAEPLWLVGLGMGVMQVFGARLGAGLAMAQGARLIRPLLVLTSIVLAMKLLWDLV